MKTKKITLYFFIILLIPTIGNSFSLEERLKNSDDEKRAQKIFTLVKCMVCDGQSVATSDVEHAKAMRSLIRKMITENKTEKEILTKIENIYGKDSIYQISITKNTAILFLLPGAFILIGAALIIVYQRKNNANS